MARTTAAEMIVIKKRELKAMIREILREDVRKIVHDELSKLVIQAEDWQMDPESPLYQAMVEIRQDIKAGGVRLLSHKEVWGE
ncbi:MAG: hypothetical protein HZC40_18860 [Chloroflexi bacterium]|nr:hypothetical protein [Chloroflexota bacterium]